MPDHPRGLVRGQSAPVRDQRRRDHCGQLSAGARVRRRWSPENEGVDRGHKNQGDSEQGEVAVKNMVWP
jgi:hypothetical protein